MVKIMRLRGNEKMPLKSYYLSDLLKLSEEKNYNLGYDINSVKGVSIQKSFIETKADMTGVSLLPYLIVQPDYFSYVSVTSRNGSKISIAYNNTDETFIVSSSYIVFYVDRTDILLPEYIFLYFNRPEFDRYTRFHSWGSAREVFSWDDMCEIEIDLPPIVIQRKYVDVYNALLQNQKIYEKGLDDLKLVCDAYIERLRSEFPSVEIGSYIQSCYEIDNGKKVIPRRGISIAKKFVVPKQEQNSARSSQIVRVGQFAYNTATTRNGETLSIAYCVDEDCAVPGIYQVFEIIDKKKSIPEYLFLWFCRKEFDRYTRWVSVGSAHEQFLLDDMKEVKIPIPDVSIQQAIVDIFNAYNKRKTMAEKLKMQMKNICPILIRGALGEVV